MGLAWAPLLWLSTQRNGLRARALQGVTGVLMIVGLSAAALLAHALPLGIQDVPNNTMGLITLLGMIALYLWLVVLQLRPQALHVWRRWSYAGFYVDEVYTRLALRLWPGRWTPDTRYRDKSALPALAADERPQNK